MLVKKLLLEGILGKIHLANARHKRDAKAKRRRSAGFSRSVFMPLLERFSFYIPVSLAAIT
jgi:hypothetical protein